MFGSGWSASALLDDAVRDKSKSSQVNTCTTPKHDYSVECTLPFLSFILSLSVCEQYQFYM
jgi:hypothetical protein